MVIEQFRMEKSPKISEKFCCELCNYACCKKNEWLRHIETSKHKNRTILNSSDKKISKNNLECKTCHKKYTARNSLWYHEQKCKPLSSDEPTIEENKVIENTENKDELIKFLVKESADLKNIILEFMKNNASGINNSNNNNTNSHNKTFNLQFFLNEQCKDAMNMSEFINQIQLKLSDLENVGKLGYVEGISNIIIKKLNDTDMYKRPLHCSDAKRETLYIKEEDKWEKESPENTNMKKMVKKVDYKNIGLIGEWKDSHPDHRESTCPDNDTYLKILVQSMSGDEEHVEKVIKKISKEVAIDK
jgi:hypothetical protein